MTTSVTISRSVPCDDIAVLIFDSRATTDGTLSSDVLARFEQQLDVIEADQRLAGVVITTAHPNAKVSGPDLSELISSEQITASLALGQNVARRLAQSRLVTLAMIQGSWDRGVAELAAWCDGRLMADQRSTSCRFSHVAQGLLPGWGGAAILPRLIGLEPALDWFTTGSTIFGTSAAAAGFADVVDVDRSPPIEAAVAWLRREIQSGDFETRRQKLAAPIELTTSQRESISRRAFARLNRMPSEQRLPAGAILNLVMTSSDRPLEDACRLEAECFTKVLEQSPCRALLNVAMLADRIRSDEGGVVQHDARRAIRQVGILGAGTMGEGIAVVNLQHGLPVVLQDASPDALSRCLTSLEQVAADEDSPNMRTPTATAANSDEDLGGCDLVIETIVENKDVKQRVLQRLDPHLASHAVVASNTSTIPISQLAESVSRPEQFCGIHFCNPVHLMPLVEVVRGEQTSESTIRSVVAYAKRIGKLPIVVNDCPGFLINRLLLLYMNEALTLYCEGVPLEQIERVAIRFGMECGPFELFDVIGVDTAMYGGKLLWEAFPERISLTPVLPAMVKRSWLGRKQGRGFYLYGSDGNRGAVDPELQGILESYVRPAGPRSDEQIQDRLLLAVLLEATRILEEGIVCDVRDIDSGLVFGLGFPRRCGGLLFWADEIGASQLLKMLKPLSKLGPRMQPTKLLLNMVETGLRFYELEGIASCDG